MKPLRQNGYCLNGMVIQKLDLLVNGFIHHQNKSVQAVACVGNIGRHALRAEEASLLGFENYAQVSLAPKMADSPSQVIGFLRDMAARAKPFAERDRAELEAFAREELDLDELHAWDLAWASEKLRVARYDFSEQEVKAYFSEARVLDGLFGIIGKLFGVRYLGTLFGLTLLSHQTGGFLGAWLGGLAITHLGDFTWMWYADMALAALAAVINLPIREQPVWQAQPA